MLDSELYARDKTTTKTLNRRGEPTPKKVRSVPIVEKVMVTVFSYAERILMVHYLKKGRTINAKYYCSSESVETKDEGLWKKKGCHGDGQNSRTEV